MVVHTCTCFSLGKRHAMAVVTHPGSLSDQWQAPVPWIFLCNCCPTSLVLPKPPSACISTLQSAPKYTACTGGHKVFHLPFSHLLFVQCLGTLCYDMLMSQFWSTFSGIHIAQYFISEVLQIWINWGICTVMVQCTYARWRNQSWEFELEASLSHHNQFVGVWLMS